MMAWIPTHFLLRTVFFFVGVLRVVFRWAALLTFLRAFFAAFLAVLFALLAVLFALVRALLAAP